MSYYNYYPPYVSVAEKKAKAAKKLKALKKKNPNIQPISIEGRMIAKSWWGKSWNTNLERYADFYNRISRGRSYVRHGAVLDLQIVAGKVNALVQGSRFKPYEVHIDIKPLPKKAWSAIRAGCQGELDSLSALLAGKFPDALKVLFYAEGGGLFPIPKEIRMNCSCPDWAVMCKHVAATLYGVGARLDTKPELFFSLRKIKIDELIQETVKKTSATLLEKAKTASSRTLKDTDLSQVFGIDLDDVSDISSLQSKSQEAPKTAAKQKRGITQLPASSSAKTKKPSKSKSHKSKSIIEVVVNAVPKRGRGTDVSAICRKTNLTARQVRNAIARTKDKGLIKSRERGRYLRK